MWYWHMNLRMYPRELSGFPLWSILLLWSLYPHTFSLLLRTSKLGKFLSSEWHLLLMLETWEVATTKELAPWPSILQISKVCALQNDLGATSCYKPVDPLRAGMHENILHRVGGFYFQGWLVPRKAGCRRFTEGAPHYTCLQVQSSLLTLQLGRGQLSNSN